MQIGTVKEPDGKALYSQVRKLVQTAKSKLDQSSYNELVELSVNYKPEVTDRAGMLWSLRRILNQSAELKSKLALILPESSPPVSRVCR